MSTAVQAQHSAGQWEQRVDSGDWDAITAEVNEHGGTLLPRLLTDAETETIRSLYTDDANFRATVNMSEPGAEHIGGEFLLLEQRPRAQSRGTAVLLPRGHGYVFTTRDRPVRSARGWAAAPVRHGVSVIRSGQRYTLGLVFHDAA